MEGDGKQEKIGEFGATMMIQWITKIRVTHLYHMMGYA